MKKKYKALLLDVDGTLIPNKRDGMPSEKVTRAIKEASKLIYVGLATSRPYSMLSHIYNHLDLSGPSIINSGSQIIDIKSRKIYIEHLLPEKEVFQICKILLKFKKPIIINDGEEDVEFSKTYKPHQPLNIFMFSLDEKIADEIIEIVSNIPTITIFKIPDWSGGERVGIAVSHLHGTKQHGVLEVAKLLNINTHEIIGVGDGQNDFPLLMACGLKVAMGNAMSDLKEIADYIAPKVENDGVADVIEKFITNNK
ncbi:MAG: HAD-IIB family hydrolase [Candidatus Levybacteria bacterium]|nr:HAD-IIB family hydrolase [Candidatus Levybacteria bacterium]